MQGERDTHESVAVSLVGRASRILSILSEPSQFSPNHVSKSSPVDSGKKKPECQPWSRADFLTRLNTFISSTWFDKPESLSAFECARHGWANIGVDTLQCLCCKRIAVVSIDRSLSAVFRENVIVQFRAQLTGTGHAPLCPWRDCPVPLTLLQLTGSSAHEVLMDCQARLDTLQACTHLPALSLDFLKSELLTNVMKAVGWPRDRKIDPAVVLACCGWEARPLHPAESATVALPGAKIDENNTTLHCVMDQRSAAAWNFVLIPNRSVTRLTNPTSGINLDSSDGASRHRGANSARSGEASDICSEKRPRATEALDDDDESSFLQDPVKRARILGGSSPAAVSGFERTATVTFGVPSAAPFRTPWGGGGLWGAGSGGNSSLREAEPVSLGYGWAQKPLGALTEPAPGAGTGGGPGTAGAKLQRVQFHPLGQHRAGSLWLNSSLPLPAGSLTSGNGTGSGVLVAWQQCLAICLASLLGNLDGRATSSPTRGSVSSSHVAGGASAAASALSPGRGRAGATTPSGEPGEDGRGEALVNQAHGHVTRFLGQP